MTSVLWKPPSYFVKHAIKAFGIGIIEEKDVHWIVWRAERG